MSVGAWTDVDRLEDPDSDYADEAVASASYILWLLSGRRYSGTRTVTEVYRRRRRRLDDSFTDRPEVVGGEIVSSFGGFYGDDEAWSTIWLRGRPVINVVDVTAGTFGIPLNQIDIVDRSQIALVFGSWMSYPEVTVTYQYGDVPPVAGVRAATELANQFVWGMTGDDRCALPAHITSVSRQGVSWTLLDTQDFLDKGRTGIYLVDLFIKAFNPNGAQKRSRVFTPDIPSGRTMRHASVRAYPPTLPSAP